MKKFLIPVLIFLGSFSLSYSKEINVQEVKQLCNSFKNGLFANTSDWQIAKYKNNIYVMNNPSGGWMLVSAEDAVPGIVLGYSTKGFLNVNELSESLESLLSVYDEGIEKVRTSSKPNITRATSNGKSVEPLLGDICWTQYYPYNSSFPYFEGNQCIAGCVQIAQGQIMYYYQYPNQGRGSHSYTWDGTTYSMDFSKSVYRWDLMKDTYDGTEDNESIEAVAKLVYDLAIANEAAFAFLTAAALNEQGMVDYFDYDPGMYRVMSKHCTRQYYEDIMRENIDAGYPLLIQGYNFYGGGHAFICDGYDDNGYFHYNMGGDTGYFLSNATGYDREQWLYCNIKPNEGGTPTMWVGSEKEFYWKGGDEIECVVKTSGLISSKKQVTVALALEDKNGWIKYFNKFQNSDLNIYIESLILSDNVDDGEYTVYPVYKVEGEDWKRINFPDNAADHILLTVKNGQKIYTNTSTGGIIDEGVVEIDGMYYRIENDEAILVPRNNLFRSYSGDVVIPDYVTIEKTPYPVTKIGESAFQECNLNNVTIGANVNTIGYNAFRNAEITGSLIYENEANITTVEQRAFIFCHIDELKVPSGVTRLPEFFTQGGAKALYLPSTLNYMDLWSICNEEELLRDVYVYWTSEEELPDYGYDDVNNYGPLWGDFSKVTLHVPNDTEALYRNNKIWGVFGKYADPAGVDTITTEEDNLVYTIENGTIIFRSLPQGQEALIYNIQGMKVGSANAGESVNLTDGIYVIKAGKTIRKVIVK